jgi:transposase
MRDAELFQMALGLSFPWKVMSSDFDAQAGRLDIRIDFPRGSRFCCPTCGTSGPAYDTREMTWRHLNFFRLLATFGDAAVNRNQEVSRQGDCGHTAGT